MEVFSGFPQVTPYVTTRLIAPAGISTHRIEVCGEAALAGGTSLKLNPEGQSGPYRIQILPMPANAASHMRRQRDAAGAPIPTMWVHDPFVPPAPDTIYIGTVALLREQEDGTYAPDPAGFGVGRVNVGDDVQDASFERFARAVEQAGGRSKLGCSAGAVFTAMDRAHP
jgi:hypothetical protein